MTQKELLYLEDAIKHEESIINILSINKNNMEQNELIDFISKEEQVHKNIYDNLLNKMEELINE